jgi:hypothetical protein
MEFQTLLIIFVTYRRGCGEAAGLQPSSHLSLQFFPLEYFGEGSLIDYQLRV